MGKQSNRKRRRNTPPSPAVARILAALTADPARRHAIREAAGTVGLELTRVWARSSVAQRSSLLLAVQAAGDHLAERKRCDFCKATARRIRFLPPRNPEDALCGFLVLCDGCAAADPAELRRKTLARYEATGLDLEAHPHYTRAILGRRVGDGSGLPARASVQDCGVCGQSMWYDQDERDWGREDDRQITYVCRQCAGRLAADGRIHNVPAFLVG